MYRPIHSGVRGLGHAFGERWVRVDCVRNVVDGAFQSHGHDCFGDGLGGSRSDDVYAQNFTVLFVADYFDESFARAQDCRFAL
jgi:hypothetical protein